MSWRDDDNPWDEDAWDPEDDHMDAEHPEGPSRADRRRFGDRGAACPNCGRDVYDDLDVCPHCLMAIELVRRKRPHRTRLFVIIAGSIALAAILLLWAVLPAAAPVI